MKKNHFFFASALVCFCITLMITVSCGKSGGYSSSGGTGGGGTTTTNTISMYNMTFTPATKTVAKGTVVKWTNDDNYAHTVNSNDGSTFSSGTVNGGGSFSYTANTPGTFDYHCTIHAGMTGTLIVTQ
jgi:plastocyanin